MNAESLLIQRLAQLVDVQLVCVAHDQIAHTDPLPCFSSRRVRKKGRFSQKNPPQFSPKFFPSLVPCGSPLVRFHAHSQDRQGMDIRCNRRVRGTMTIPRESSSLETPVRPVCCSDRYHTQTHIS